MWAFLGAALPYIVPAVTSGIGYIVGWFHHKLTHKPVTPAKGA